MSEKIWSLKRCGLFERLTPAELDRLERHALTRTFQRGEIIYFPTEPGESVLVLARGRVKIKDVTPDGKETILTFIEEGELFGELALVDSEPRSEYAETVEDSQVIVIPRHEVIGLMQQRPDLALSITKLVGLRRRRVEHRLRSILFRSNRQRLLSVMLELLKTHGRRQGDHWEIALRLSHQNLASLIGATRETVTVLLGELRVEQLIEIRKRRIIIPNRDRLLVELNQAEPAATPTASRSPILE